MNVNRTILTTIATVALSLGAATSALAQSAVLISRDASSRINVRSQPSTQARSPHYGFAGDRVQVLWSTEGSDRQLWRYVKFNRSGAEGWVRSDFVNVAGAAKPIYDVEAKRLQLQRQYARYTGWDIQDVRQEMRRLGYRPAENRQTQVAYVVDSYRVAFNFNDRTETVIGVQVNATGLTN